MTGGVAVERSSPALLGQPHACVRKRQELCKTEHPFVLCNTSLLGKECSALMGKQVCSHSWCSILPVIA